MLLKLHAHVQKHCWCSRVPETLLNSCVHQEFGDEGLRQLLAVCLQQEIADKIIKL